MSTWPHANGQKKKHLKAVEIDDFEDSGVQFAPPISQGFLKLENELKHTETK